ncbi:LacI family DNA-binding transcriptional regulator [Solimonas marina]|uniref:Substrate-binding domain-containing protein n=1 Tax=Solimonas marina TaxID=2714601 RepID=A0A969W7N5_9GAMM|nr:substrate-binding domain-containing protein [Solimonas marina]
MSVSIRDVARVAGVSVATVSRALGNGPVSDALRAQVEAAVKATGYHPNLSARRLRSQRSGTIGLVVADIRNPFFTAVAHAAEDAAYRAGLRLILCNTEEDPAREAIYLGLMQEERVSGLLFAPTRLTQKELPRQRFAYPVVLIDRTGPNSAHDSVTLDNHAAMGALIDHLVEQGYRRIGGLFGKTSNTGVERRNGYLAGMLAHGLTPDYREVAPSAVAAHAEATQWLARGDRPEALVTSNSLLMTGAMKAAREAGLRIPEQLALAGFDNESWTELVEPGITVIEQPVEEIGRTAMNLLLERLQNPALPVRKLVLGGRCIVRGSTQARASMAGVA